MKGFALWTRRDGTWERSGFDTDRESAYRRVSRGEILRITRDRYRPDGPHASHQAPCGKPTLDDDVPF